MIVSRIVKNSRGGSGVVKKSARLSALFTKGTVMSWDLRYPIGEVSGYEVSDIFLLREDHRGGVNGNVHVEKM
eukprot:5495717-Pleurochrysis_carterae.AAC.1